MTHTNRRGSHRDSIAFPHPGVFWTAIAACTAGVLLHLPMYLKARNMGYHLAGMRPDPPMLIGMVLIIIGLIGAGYGVFPRRAEGSARHTARVSIKTLDEARIRPAHVGLLVAMATAVTIDVMKSTTLAFVAPGVAKEYNLTSTLNPHGGLPVALLPLAGISGTVVGSLLWGWLGDRIGRRASILLAGVLFIATAVCGAMPGFGYNLLMCFVMGLGVGGMLPITFALIAETIPRRHRSWLMVLIGGDVAGAYVITSWLAAELTPTYSWRILWLLGMPTGVLLILLNRWIPESPRFLLATARWQEAQAVLDKYGAVAIDDQQSELLVENQVHSNYRQLFYPPFVGLTTAVILLGLGVGLVAFGFQLWIPTNLQRLGFTEVTADRILRDSALIGFPLNFAVAFLYGFWSSKKTTILLAGLTATALAGFAVAGDAVTAHPVLLYALLTVPIWAISSLVAVLAAYSSEIYPTRIRSRGTGLAAGTSKAGGVLIIALITTAITPPSITATALLGALPLALALIILTIFGIETHGRQLEKITAEQLNIEMTFANPT